MSAKVVIVLHSIHVLLLNAVLVIPAKMVNVLKMTHVPISDAVMDQFAEMENVLEEFKRNAKLKDLDAHTQDQTKQPVQADSILLLQHPTSVESLLTDSN